jgi:hypothetical protein
MINHGRNLLLNVSPQRIGQSDAGYEYIPADYTPFRFNQALSVIHRILFGSKPDNKFLNLRAKELLTYVHETEFSSYLYKLDSRVTYWPRTEAPSFLYSKKITITQISGAPRRLGVGGVFNANNATGKAERNYLLDLTSEDGEFTATVRPLGAFGTSASETFPTIGAAPPISVPETGIKINLASSGQSLLNKKLLTEIGDMLVVEDYDPFGYLLLEESDGTNILPLMERPVSPVPAAISSADAKWVINMQANPSPAITTLLPALELVGEPVFLELFGVSSVEPYTTFKNLWFDHPLPNYRLAGLTLAFIYRAEEQRLKNG